MADARILWLVMGLGGVVYVLSGGADYGAGFWYLLSRRYPEDRRIIERALAPIWEANHVWLVFVVVVLFTAFPRAFSTVSVALHIPITLALLGMVLRGSAFVFHAYGPAAGGRSPWQRLFGISSVVTPVLLGVVLAAVGSGTIRRDGTRVTSGFFAGWLTPFAWLTGLLALSLFSLLAATYLTVEASGATRERFRKRALAAELVGGVVAYAVLYRAAVDAPLLYQRLGASSLGWGVHGATALAAAFAIAALWWRRFRWARVAVAAQVTLVLAGFGAAMGDALVLPDVTIQNAGGRAATARAMIVALGVGAVLLVPALVYLFRVFKGHASRS